MRRSPVRARSLAPNPSKPRVSRGFLRSENTSFLEIMKRDGRGKPHLALQQDIWIKKVSIFSLFNAKKQYFYSDSFHATMKITKAEGDTTESAHFAVETGNGGKENGNFVCEKGCDPAGDETRVRTGRASGGQLSRRGARLPVQAGRRMPGQPGDG